MSDKADPCPFCGCEHVSAEPDIAQGGKWGAITCQGCAAKGPEVRTGYRDSEVWRDAAIVEWNRRASPGGKTP